MHICLGTWTWTPAQVTLHAHLLRHLDMDTCSGTCSSTTVLAPGHGHVLQYLINIQSWIPDQLCFHGHLPTSTKIPGHGNLLQYLIMDTLLGYFLTYQDTWSCTPALVPNHGYLLISLFPHGHLPRYMVMDTCSGT